MVVAIVLQVFAILVGALGAAGFIVSKRPDAKDALAKLAPYQGIMGTVGALFGIWGIVGGVGALSASVVFGALGIASGVCMFGTGFLLGFPWFMSFNKSPEAAAKAEQLRGKMVVYQVPMGLVCVVLGLVGLVMTLLR